MKFSQFKRVLNHYDYLHLNRLFMKRSHEPACLFHLLKWYNKNKPGFLQSSKHSLTPNQFYELILLEIEIRKWQKQVGKDLDQKTLDCITDIYKETGFSGEVLDELYTFIHKVTPEVLEHLLDHQNHIAFYKILAEVNINVPLHHRIFYLTQNENQKIVNILSTLKGLGKLSLNNLDFILDKISIDKLGDACKGEMDINRWQLIVNHPNPNYMCDFIYALQSFPKIINTIPNLILLSELDNPNSVIIALNKLANSSSANEMNQIMFESIVNSSIPVQLANAFLTLKNSVVGEQQAIIYSNQPEKMANALAYAKSKPLTAKEIGIIRRCDKPLETAYAFAKLQDAKIMGFLNDTQLNAISKHPSPQLLASAIMKLVWNNKLDYLNGLLTQKNPINYVESLNVRIDSVLDATLFKNNLCDAGKQSDSKKENTSQGSQTPTVSRLVAKVN